MNHSAQRKTCEPNHHGRTGTDLTQARLARADLTEARLLDADLRNATLHGTNVTGASLQHADLTDTDLTRVVGLTSAQLARAKVSRRTRVPDGVEHPERG